jgi:hypothetical protein
VTGVLDEDEVRASTAVLRMHTNLLQPLASAPLDAFRQGQTSFQETTSSIAEDFSSTQRITVALGVRAHVPNETPAQHVFL